MWQKFCSWLLFKKLGWSEVVTQEHPDKYIICLAPHTSNWDLLLGQLYIHAKGMKSNFLMKKEWFFWPLGPIFRKMGGIPVYRQKKTSMTDSMAETARQAEQFHLCITPEGTRSRTEEWKKGFYFIALKANMPILLYGADYERRLIQCTKTIVPNGDLESQMKEIKLYFKDFKGKKPENFTIGNVLLGLLLTLLIICPASAQDYKGEPWVKNVSQPYKVTRGLEGRHLSLWASHGRYYDTDRSQWRWQRPTLFCTNEDLYTQTIVVPYLIPMLENAGANVFTPRERDWQRHEVIVDNDDHTRLISYIETGFKQPWTTTDRPGFAFHHGNYQDGENPFLAGTARLAKTTGSKSKYSLISYQPDLPEEGRYAVYVSYQTMDKSIDDAHYTVWHKGEKTEFHVNQQMGGSTWVYLGTFDFDKGCNQFNRVTLTNQSSHGGGHVVTADAVRFGGGMGNIERGGTVSGLPRCLEGARYSTQWMGMPYHVYVRQDDYKDDINTRPKSTNYVAGGSCYLPEEEGLRVPLELSLAVHSDAGYAPNGESVFGTLTICTTDNNGKSAFPTGKSRKASRQLADDLLSNTYQDLCAKYGSWVTRTVYDRNYSETRNPEIPSAIIETLSHQSFPDMRYGQDPNFRFTLARSIYKTLLRYINRQHGDNFAVAPLAPTNLKVEFVNKKGEIKLTWTPVDDPQEPSAEATSYIVYTATGHGDFDNGTAVRHTSLSKKLEPGELYSFRVAAINKGGRSFPTEVVSARYIPQASGTVLIVNGFHRLSSPAIIKNDSLQGFDLDADPGVTYGRTAGFTGRQLVFNRSRIGLEDETGLGYGTTELAGMFIAGNEFNYIKTHAEAIAASTDYSIVSCSADVLEQGRMKLESYSAIDLILGLERNDGHSLVAYKSFSPALQQQLRRYTLQGGSLFVSGAYVGSDMLAEGERAFLADVLKCSYGGKDPAVSETINGMNTRFDFYRNLNEQHYAATHPDILQPTEGTAFPLMAYADNYGAAVAYQGRDYRAVTMGFPFECIKERTVRNSIMAGILQFLIK